MLKPLIVLLFVVLVFAGIAGLLWLINRGMKALDWENKPWH